MLSESSEKSNRNPKAEKKKGIIEEAEKDLDSVKVIILAAEATKHSQEKIEVKSFEDLKEKNPALATLIDKVANDFGVPRELLCAIFDHESNFKHGLRGDLHLKGNSVGIGQFRDGTWGDIYGKDAKEFAEFREYMDKYYAGRTFERGENILADIAATAAYLKYLGGSRTNFERLSEHRLVYLRARYVGDKEYKAQMRYYVGGQYDKVHPRYKEFIQTCKKFEEG